MTFMTLFHTGQGKKKREKEALVTNMYEGPMMSLVVLGVLEKRSLIFTKSVLCHLRFYTLSGGERQAIPKINM